MRGERLVQDFTLHLVFSTQGAHDCADYVRPQDRIAVMAPIQHTAHARLRGCAAQLGVIGTATASASLVAPVLDHSIDYSELVRWCADAARTVSWR